MIKDYVAVHLGTAHPHKLKDGSIIFYGTNMNYKQAYNFIAIPPQSDPSKCENKILQAWLILFYIHVVFYVDCC